MSSRSQIRLDATVADCGLVAELALNVYRSCKTSAADFQSMSDDMSTLYMTLRDIREDLSQDASGLSHTGVDSLRDKLNTVHGALRCIDEELKNYERMTFSSRLRWAYLKDVLPNTGEAHTRIVGTTTALRLLEKKMSMTCDKALEKQIVKYLREVRDGLHEDSVMNLVPTEMPSKHQRWQDFKEELQRYVGIPPAVVDDHWDFIHAVVRRAQKTGDYDIELPEPSQDERALMKQIEESLVRRSKDMDKNMNELRQRAPHIDSKKTSPIVTIGLRALRIVSDERLIVAADEGDLKRVKTLINRRANVNASDRWRWTALHMAAYGGYNEIAKELIAAGADLTARTVDGETPLRLAETNRHVDVAATIQNRVDELHDQAGRQKPH
ncbi:hypothetical protein ABZX51_011056 [Aspergillus tubingensis]